MPYGSWIKVVPRPVCANGCQYRPRADEAAAKGYWAGSVWQCDICKRKHTLTDGLGSWFWE